MDTDFASNEANYASNDHRKHLKKKTWRHIADVPFCSRNRGHCFSIDFFRNILSTMSLPINTSS